MTPNADFFNQIDDYCFEQLNDNEMLEFEAELSLNPELNNEMELWIDIGKAVQEKEVLSLRKELSKVATQHKPNFKNSESFEMLNDISDFQEISEILSAEELINYFDSLPKAHVYHQKTAPSENIHHFYKEQNGKGVDENADDFDLSEFEGLEDAILEKDILQFRQTLKQVAKSIQPQFGIENVDNYINNELVGDDFINFESNLIKNKSLQNEVKLQREIDSAIGESDIYDLRNQLTKILQTETSWNVRPQHIEDFVDGILEDNLLDEFNSEFVENLDLQTEVSLRRQVNEAIGEYDIFELRAKLKSAKETSEVKKKIMIIPETKMNKMHFWRNSVAIFLVLLGLAGVLTNELFNSDRMYEKYYSMPSWSQERSLSNEITILQQANVAYSKGEYGRVIEILNQLPLVTSGNPVYQFYKAASLQSIKEYDKSIELYSKIIKQGDNLFIEEAEWYRSLCYFKSGDDERAKLELLAVIERKGHFEKDAKAILRRMRYTIK